MQPTKIVIANCSPNRQIRWATAIVPNDTVKDWPNEGWLNGHIIIRGKKTRPAGENIYVLADMEGGGVRQLSGDIVAGGVPKPQPSRLVPNYLTNPCHLYVGGASDLFKLQYIQAETPWRLRAGFIAKASGVIGHLIFDVWAWQDTVDVYGRVTYSDPDSALWTSDPGQDIRITSTLGKFYLDFDRLWSQGGEGTNTIKPLNDSRRIPDAMSIPFVGIWQPDVAEPPADDPLSPLWGSHREPAIFGAKGGPLVADLPTGQRRGNWFALGRFVDLPGMEAVATQEAARFEAKANSAGDIAANRELACPINVGATGHHKSFGWWKDAVLLHGNNPKRIWQLRESAYDVFLRSCHHFEANGQPVKFADHPGWRTWSGTTHFTGSDKLGKPLERYYPWGHGLRDSGTGQVRHGFDDQHWSTPNYSSAYHAVSDDPLIEASIFEELQTDLARAKRHWSTLDAPRASARLLRKWAQYWWVSYNDKNKADCELMSKEILHLYDSGLWADGKMTPWGQLGDCKPPQVMGPDPRVLANDSAWVPWQSALLIMGLAHQWALWQHIGDDAQANKAMRLAVMFGDTMVKYGTVRDNNTGRLLPLTGVKWLPGGQPNSPEYYTYPRDGAGPGGVVDMLVGSGGWFTGMGNAGAMMFLREHTQDSQSISLLDEILPGATVPSSIGQAEWLI